METSRFQEARRSGTVPTANLMVPGIWAERSLDDVADTDDEVPGKSPRGMSKAFFGEGLELGCNILPFRGNRDFIPVGRGSHGRLGWAFTGCGPELPHEGWSVGRPRRRSPCRLRTTISRRLDDG
jgi:hypothetical protein